MFKEIPISQRSINSRKLILGVGVNDASYQTKLLIDGREYVCPYYKRWGSMIRRCYSKKALELNKTYKEATVCPEWLVFSNFRKWMRAQNWKGLQLDKDVVSPKNSVYCPEFCAFVTSQVNSLLTDHGAARGPYPQGVTLHKKGILSAAVNIRGARKLLGRFTRVIDASNAYLTAKSGHVLSMAGEQTDPRVKAGLIKHAEILKSKIKKD